MLTEGSRGTKSSLPGSISDELRRVGKLRQASSVESGDLRYQRRRARPTAPKFPSRESLWLVVFRLRPQSQIP